MHKKILLALCCLLMVTCIKAQITPSGTMGTQSAYVPPADKPVYIYIPDSTILAAIHIQGKPVFTIPGMNTIVNQYNVTGFKKSYPASRYLLMRSIYQMNVSDTMMLVSLMVNYPQYISGWELMPQEGHLYYYTPNDYPHVLNYRETGYLDYINAEDAWNYSKGDSTIIIGLHDDGLDTLHDDLKDKLDTLQNMAYNDIYGVGHATHVAGLIAGETDNFIPTPPWGHYPSIGFKCKLDYVNCMANFPPDSYQSCPGFIATSERVKIMNLSSGNSSIYDTLFRPYSSFFFGMETIQQEIYENGTLFVAAAGNGDPQLANAWMYAFPSSLDYVFSVSGIGWKHDYNYGLLNNIKGLHEEIKGDSTTAFQHNDRVDILAPAFDVGGLQLNNGYTYWGKDGTSVAAPLVAGTAGLMLSANPCLTPYQMEYILKTSANDSVLTIPENLKYAGKLGAGALDAGKAVKNAYDGTIVNSPGYFEFNCNNPATQTMYIEGVDLSTRCIPNYGGNGVKPKLTPIIRNGTPPYTARWEPWDKQGNNCTLNAYDVFSPEVISTTSPPAAYGKFRLTIYDNSPVQKVASKIISFHLWNYIPGTGFDLAGKDGPMDMYHEPNDMHILDPREDWYVESPDLWNRQYKDGDTVHQSPEYFSQDSNYVYVKIRNVGCTNYPGYNYLRLYWTVASTGEDWSDDWDGTTHINTSTGVRPGGGELTLNDSIPIPAIQPGQSITIVRGWKPVKPQDYDANNLNVCLLARIIHPIYPLNETLNTNVLQNVKANNGIITRNLWVEDLNPYNKPTISLRSYIANAEDDAGLFDIQFITERDVHRHFAGNFSAVGRVTIYLGDLYDLWVDAGGEGTYLSRDPETKTVMYDGSTPLELLNIELPPDEKFPVDIEFSLLPDAVIPEYTYFFRLRQFAKMGPQERLPNVYGGMGFKIHTTNEDEPAERPANSNDIISSSSSFSLHPNPAHDFIKVSYLNNQLITADVTIYDIMGRKMAETKNRQFQNSYVELSTSELVPGVYFVEITNNRGVNEKLKFVKQ